MSKLKFVLRFAIHIVIILCICTLTALVYYPEIGFRALLKIQLDFIWYTVGAALGITWIVRKF